MAECERPKVRKKKRLKIESKSAGGTGSEAESILKHVQEQQITSSEGRVAHGDRETVPAQSPSGSEVEKGIGQNEDPTGTAERLKEPDLDVGTGCLETRSEEVHETEEKSHETQENVSESQEKLSEIAEGEIHGEVVKSNIKSEQETEIEGVDESGEGFPEPVEQNLNIHKELPSVSGETPEQKSVVQGPSSTYESLLRELDKLRVTEKTLDSSKVSETVGVSEEENEGVWEEDAVPECDRRDDSCSKISSETKEEIMQPLPLSQMLSFYHNVPLEQNPRRTLAFRSLYLKPFLNPVALEGENSERQQKTPANVLAEMLLTFYRSEEQWARDRKLAENQKETCQELDQKTWIKEKQTFSGRGECEEGAPLEAKVEVEVAHLNKNKVSEFKGALSSLRSMMSSEVVLSGYAAAFIRMKIESHLSSVLSTARESGSCLSIFEALSVLFAFLRRPLPRTLAGQTEPRRKDDSSTEDAEKQGGFFKHSIKLWIRVLASALHSEVFGGPESRLFLLNHALRLPPGEAVWAAQFVLESPLTAEESLVTLATLLLPVEDRKECLRAWSEDVKREMEENEDWVIVETSDGEEEQQDGPVQPLESDLIAVLDLVSFELLSMEALSIRSVPSATPGKGSELKYHLTSGSRGEFLKVIATFTTLLKICYASLRHYVWPRYNSFSRRVIRLVCHSVHYMADHWENVSLFLNPADTTFNRRLQLEVDIFLFRCISVIHEFREAGGWQYLSELPFHACTLEALRSTRRFLFANSPERRGIPESIPKTFPSSFSFPTLISTLPETDGFYLLATLETMARSRPATHQVLILDIMEDILQVGFLDAFTRDSYSKPCRDLLGSLLSAHHFLFAHLIQLIWQHAGDIKDSALYLIPALPWSDWTLDFETANLICTTLAGPASFSDSGSLIGPSRNTVPSTNFNSWEHQIARCLLSCIIWEGVSVASQQVVALALSQTYRQLNSVASKQQRDALLKWHWAMADRLCLHQNDDPVRGELGVRVLEQKAFGVLPPSLATESVTEDPFISYLCLLGSDAGHSIPLIFSDGLRYLQALNQDGRYRAVLRCLRLILPLVFPCHHDLQSDKRFLAVVNALLMAEGMSYVQMAKKMVTSSWTPGPVLTELRTLIWNQLENSETYGSGTSTSCVSLWLSTLSTVQPNFTEIPACVFLLDSVCQGVISVEKKTAADASQRNGDYTTTGGSTWTSYGLPTGTLWKHLVQEITSFKADSGSSGVRGVLSWVTGGGGGGGKHPSLPPSPRDYPWYSLAVLEGDALGERELWDKIREVMLAKKEATPAQAMKRACSQLGLGSRSLEGLTLLRVARVICESDPAHPCFLLLCQLFFRLYVVHCPRPQEGSIGFRFLSDGVGFQYLKALKKKLREAKTTSAILIPTFILWLEEACIHEPHPCLPSLPPLFRLDLLQTLIEGRQELWLEHLPNLEAPDCPHRPPRRRKHAPSASLSATDRILKRLALGSATSIPSGANQKLEPGGWILVEEREQSGAKNREAPRSLPSLFYIGPTDPEVLSNKKATLTILEKPIQDLEDASRKHEAMLNNLSSLDKIHLDLIPHLYTDRNEMQQVEIHCRTHTNKKINKFCTGYVVVSYVESTVNEGMAFCMQGNRREWSSVLRTCLRTPATCELLEAALFLERVVEDLVNLSDAQGSAVGSSLFYHLVSLLEKPHMCSYPPVRQLITEVVDRLGTAFIANRPEESEALVAAIIACPSQTGFLSPHLNLASCHPPLFIRLYQTLAGVPPHLADLGLVLLSKCDFPTWLRTHKPKSSECQGILQIIFKAVSHREQRTVDEGMLAHFRCLLRWEFPEQYGAVFHSLLKSSHLSSTVHLWLSFVEVVGGGHVTVAKRVSTDGSSSRTTLAVLDEAQWANFARRQRGLNSAEVMDTMQLLSSVFAHERSRQGPLPSAFKPCIPQLSYFMGMITHASVIGALNQDPSALSDDLLNPLLPKLENLFNPWLQPAQSSQQQPPFTSAHENEAMLIVKVLVETLLFVQETLPGESCVLPFVWSWYLRHFGRSDVPGHVVSLIQGSHVGILRLPWEKFAPSVRDTDFMIKLAEQYCPIQHAFLAQLLIRIQWPSVLHPHPPSGSPHPAALMPPPSPLPHPRLKWNFFLLLVKLALEPGFMEHPRVDLREGLLAFADSLDWSDLPIPIFERALDWFILAVSPTVIFLPPEDATVEGTILRLLQSSSSLRHGVYPRPDHQKLFLRAFVRLFSSAIQQKQKSTAVEPNEREALRRMFATLDRCQPPSPRPLLMELVSVACLTPACVEAVSDWLTTQGNSSPLILPAVSVLTPPVRDICVSSSERGEPSPWVLLLEDSVAAWMRGVDTGYRSFPLDWSPLLSVVAASLPPFPANSLLIMNELIPQSALLTLTALLKWTVIHSAEKADAVLADAIKWLPALPMSDRMEAKFPVFLHALVSLILSKASASSILSFCACLEKMAQPRTYEGFFGSIGIGKRSGRSVRYRFLCQAASLCLQRHVSESALTSGSSEDPTQTTEALLLKLKTAYGSYFRTEPELSTAIDAVQMFLDGDDDVFGLQLEGEDQRNSPIAAACPAATTIPQLIHTLAENLLPSPYLIWVRSQ